MLTWGNKSIASEGPNFSLLHDAVSITEFSKINILLFDIDINLYITYYLIIHTVDGVSSR